ncbi:MAG: hypothetical protein ACR2PI_00760 [Hyphomicrobiaceae bacterium]
MKIASLVCALALLVAMLPAQMAEAANGKKSVKKKPLRVVVTRGRRVGGYTYSKSEAMSAKDTRRFVDPIRQSPSGPFDSGFFFEQPMGPRGGYTPYMQ